MKKYKALEEEKMHEQMRTEIRKTKIKRPFDVNKLDVNKDLFANIGQTQIGTVQEFLRNHS